MDESKNKSKSSKTNKVTAKGIPLKWHIPDNIITRFASYVVVQALENEFKVSFFEMNPEIILDESHEIPKEVQATCVASIIISANKLPVFAKVLQQQCDKLGQIIIPS